MKKILLGILVAFIVVGFTGQSWAFGSRGHHGGTGQGDSSQGNSGNVGNSGNGSNQSENNPQTSNNGQNSNSQAGVPGNSNFPVAPVPEPMTLSLLGTGLAGFLLKRKTS